MSNIGQLEKVVRNCRKCNGLGVVSKITEGGILLEDCKCIKKISDSVKLMQANIPDQYWGFNLDKLNSSFIKNNEKQLAKVHEYVNNLPRNLKNGRGIWFCSSPGLGKSIIIASILKSAIDQGFSAYCDRASHIISLKFHALNDSEAYDLVNYIVKDVDILAIEEIEKIYLVDDESMPNQLFYEFISDVYDSKKSLLLTSNIPKVDALMKFPTFIQDRLRTLPTIIFIGKSERAKLK